MKKTSIILIIIVLAVFTAIGYIKYNRSYLPNEIKFSDADIHYGCYWGDINQKKVGTPSNWVLINSGTKSAQWCDPVKAAGMVQ